MIIQEMCVLIFKTRPGVGKEGTFLCVSVSNFPCYNKKSHHLLEIWSVSLAPGKCFFS